MLCKPIRRKARHCFKRPRLLEEMGRPRNDLQLFRTQQSREGAPIELDHDAIEASDDGEVITAGCKGGDSSVTFWVHNRAFIPKDVQLQLFKRSFSTKGLGRGLGTYSMLLLTEKYLKGHVSFSSTEAQGTTFTVALPPTPR